jgi:hypothetical protein
MCSCANRLGQRFKDEFNRHGELQILLLRYTQALITQMTQELMSKMLGVRREGITEAAGKLQKLGALEYGRGQITVLDRVVLEKLCCECYAVVRRETDRVMPFPTGYLGRPPT